MTKHPTNPGLYWATLDDGNGNIEVTVLRVEAFQETPLDEAAMCHFADARDGDLQFEVKGFAPQVVRPWCTIYLGYRTSTSRDEVLVTWHGPVKPPASARNQKAEVTA
ncbi:MAG TPA: hypothetical protein VGN60_07785 [Devosia sp.]|jgi:hypothetical protein|nr:hypothetical protein [Devosia sp.]